MKVANSRGDSLPAQSTLPKWLMGVVGHLADRQALWSGMAKCLHGGPLEGGESVSAPSRRVCEPDDCQLTIESHRAPILLRTDGLILMRQNRGRHSLRRLDIRSQTL